MINIIRATNYQLRRSIGIYLAIFGGLLLGIVPILGIKLNQMSELNGGMYGRLYLGFMLFLPYILSCDIGSYAVGVDMGDKTINYEVMSGHSRTSIFWARIITAYVWCIGWCIVLAVLPLALVTAINGWGSNVIFSEILVRYLLHIVAAVRITAFVILMTTILRHPGAGGFASYGILNVSIVPLLVIGGLYDKKLYHVLAMSDIAYMSGIMNMTTVVEDAETVAKFDMSLPENFAIHSTITAFAVSAVYLLLAFWIFKRRDMR